MKHALYPVVQLVGLTSILVAVRAIGHSQIGERCASRSYTPFPTSGGASAPTIFHFPAFPTFVLNQLSITF
jgi:hypothetical protein